MQFLAHSVKNICYMGIKTQSVIIPKSFLLLLFLMISLSKLIEKGSSVLADEMTYVRIFF